MNKTLIVMRHAEAAGGAGSDRKRPLTSHGRSQARLAAAWLQERALRPKIVLVSSAVRTVQTAAEMTMLAKMVELDELYASSARVIEQVVRTHGSGESVMVIAHNPGVTYFCRDLAAAMPTAGICVLDYAWDWPSFAIESAEIRETSF